MVSSSRKKKLKNSYQIATCIQANHTRIPFGEQRKRATRPLEIIHTDVCGPIIPETWDKYRYFVTFLDDYTNFATIYLMEGKGDVLDVLEKMEEFISQAKVKWNKKTAEIRCDNGKEYSSREFKNWCKNKGIFINYTPPYTPQLNGKAERLNRTLIEKTRAMIKGDEENKKLWGEAVRVAAYLHNRSRTKTNTQTAYEMWNDEKPNLKHLRIFGCMAYAKELGQLRKLDNRSKVVKFVGYTQIGYRLWDPIKRKIIISREVHFDEKEEDYKKSKEENVLIKGKRNKIFLQDEDEDEEMLSNNEDEDITRDNEKDEEDKEENLEEEVEEENDMETIKREDNLLSKQDDDTPRRSQRERKFPERYNTYVFLTYDEIMKSKEKKEWMKAIEDEKKSLDKNKKHGK